VDRKVSEILGTRGKRNINRKKQVEVLHTLLQVAEEPVAKVKVLLALVSVRFDQVTGLQAYMPSDSWKL